MISTPIKLAEGCSMIKNLKKGINPKKGINLKNGIIGFILLLFVLSVAPLVLADGDADKDIDKNNANEKSEIKIEIKEKLRERKENLEEKTQQRQEIISQARERVREVKEKVADASLKSSEVKDKYTEAKQKYRRQREVITDLKERVRNCDKDCQKKKSQLKHGVSQHLIKTGELMEWSIEHLLQRLEHAPISQEEKDTATATLLALEERLIQQRKLVENLGENASNEQLREAIADLKSTWKEVRQVQNRVIASLTQAKLSVLLEKHQEYLNGLDLRIASLKEKGLDARELEVIRNQFEKHIQQFSLDFAKVEEIWMEAQTGRDVLRELHNGQQQLKEEIKITKRLLHEFMNKFKQLNKLAKTE